MKTFVTLFLFLLGAWGIFASRSLKDASRPWSLRRRLFLSSIVLLVGSAWGIVATSLAGRLAIWLFVPLGVSYLLMLSLPCYFPWLTLMPRRRILRNVIFVLFAAFCIATGFKIIPVKVIGL